MSKARAIVTALDEQERDNWQCQSCSAPAEEDGDFCMSCRLYWQDTRESAEDELLAAGTHRLTADGLVKPKGE